jgi:hypothetical protein
MDIAHAALPAPYQKHPPATENLRRRVRQRTERELIEMPANALSGRVLTDARAPLETALRPCSNLGAVLSPLGALRALVGT